MVGGHYSIHRLEGVPRGTHPGAKLGLATVVGLKSPLLQAGARHR